MQVVLNPTNVLVGDTQLLTVNIQETDGNPVTAFSGTAITDNVFSSISFMLISGTANDGTWQGSWVMPEDTYCHTYQIVLLVTNALGVSDMTISFK